MVGGKRQGGAPPALHTAFGGQARSQPAATVDPARAEQGVGERDQARPAQAADAPTADHGKLDRAALPIDDSAVHRAAVGAHAAAYAAAFKRGARAARAGEGANGVPQTTLE